MVGPSVALAGGVGDVHDGSALVNGAIDGNKCGSRWGLVAAVCGCLRGWTS